MSKKSGSNAGIIVLTITLMVFLTFLIVSAAIFAKLSESPDSEVLLSADVISELATESYSVKINMENCTMVVGTKVLVNATIYPNGSTTGIRWTSSNEEALTVDTLGNVNVIGTGLAVLTASVGTKSDSIAIECVDSMSNALLNLPDYSTFMVSGPVKTDDDKNSSSTRRTTSSSDKSGELTDNPSSEDGKNPSESDSQVKQPTSPTATNNQPTGQIPNTTTSTQPTGQTPNTVTQPVTKPTVTSATKPSKEPTQPATKPTAPTTSEYTGVKILSTEEVEKLVPYGFTKYLDNTYVFEDNGSYNGEIIVSSNMLNIYIKNRTDNFDKAISRVLSDLLPESYATVWNMYTTATTDETIYVDGRNVRVVVPADGGHTQIVVYN